MRHVRGLVPVFLFILIFTSLSAFLPVRVKAKEADINLQAVPGPNRGEVTLYWQHADSADNYHLVYGREENNFEYGALDIGRINTITVKFLSPGTTYYFALIPLFGGRPLYTTHQVKAVAKMPVENIMRNKAVKVEAKGEDLSLSGEAPLVSEKEPDSLSDSPAEISPESEEIEQEVFLQEKVGRAEANVADEENQDMPICQDMESGISGWYWSDAGNLIKEDQCDGCYAFCSRIGLDSKGWYSSCDNSLIVQADCAPE